MGHHELLDLSESEGTQVDEWRFLVVQKKGEKDMNRIRKKHGLMSTVNEQSIYLKHNIQFNLQMVIRIPKESPLHLTHPLTEQWAAAALKPQPAILRVTPL